MEAGHLGLKPSVANDEVKLKRKPKAESLPLPLGEPEPG